MQKNTLQHKFPTRFFSAEKVLIASGGVGVAAILVIVGLLLSTLRDDATLAAQRSASNLIQLIEADIRRNTELYDLAIQGVIAAEKIPRAPDLPPETEHALKFARVATTRFMGGLLRLNATGDVIADSAYPVPRQRNFADRDYFLKHRNDTDLGLQIGRPIRGRMNDQDWRITFSRRVSDTKGRFDGIIVGGMRVAYFDQLFAPLQIGAKGAINLLRTDGILMARRGPSGEPVPVGQDFSQYPNFQRILREGEGSFLGQSNLDRQGRFYTFARLGDLPLILVVALSADEAYAQWSRAATVIGAMTLALCLGVIGVVWLMLRELQQRRANERKLTALSLTDGLTGLANRRHLDEVLESQSRLSARNTAPLSLLMIDVDHFKAFNDRYGHRSGDLVLSRLARVIQGVLHRPCDLAARYGGEEFAVVLPDTDAQGAMQVAEGIRAAVEAHPAGAPGETSNTVSIGVASRILAQEISIDQFVKEADDALYAAKRAGRNRVAMAGPA
ncbi:GGDEF domain-containing protein [Rhodoferax koreense]|uniref:diguanylate cyclase n=1 Tax=Rhodoferax koreensis TaxID=1842727 RepID=A0A1P8JVF4_9BURK|nr:sensor domain-containing diguanylate cyclase [Rhodoferax koreense]APW37749.1 GGDEF domain-containing protein [Rhodoferax koreense]